MPTWQRRASTSVGGRITLVTNPRVLGYQFNPASFYLCRSAADKLECVVVEVHNTHGERHLYTLRPERSGEAHLQRANGQGVLCLAVHRPGRPTTASRCATPTTVLAIGINERETDEPLLATSLTLRRVPLSRRNLINVLVRHPLMSHRTTALIHWHALRLWLKGVPFHPHRAALETAPADRSAT